MHFRLTERYCFAIALMFSLMATAAAAEEVDFERDIAPILEDRCLYCHGEDEQESGLRLDLRAKMLRGGDSGLSAVVPGKPEKSYLIEVINHIDEEMAMPPDEDKLPAEEIKLLTRWIKEGAVWPGQMDAVDEETSDHWSFQTLMRPDVPEVDGTVPNPIDAFLTQTLKEHGLAFSPPADPRSLVRRASIVLTGLAPTPEQTAQFVQAYQRDDEKAYTALVDRLLASEHFGERWAQHWLDVIRWAETNGSEANLYRKNAWIYRDYVVRAFNEDIPYDQFVQEQIAGDSMGVGEATGFLVAGPHVPAATVGREPAAIRQARADRMDEIMQTVGASVMGVTIGCARCHNHKFDPISIKDYYSMTGVFQDVEFGSRFPEFSDEHPRKQRGKELWRGIAQQRRILRPFGGKHHDRLRVYGNGWYQGPRDPAFFAEAAVKMAEKGYTALKFDPFGGAFQQITKESERLSVKIVRAVRDAVGDDVDLLIEAHDRFTVTNAIRLGRKLEEFEPMWLETPVRTFDLKGHIEVAKAIKIPVVLGEGFKELRQFADLLSYRIIDIIQPEPMSLGTSQARKSFAVAEAYTALVACHQAQSPLGTAINAHLHASIPNFLIQENFDDNLEPWTWDVLTGVPRVDGDGLITVPDTPGWGVELNEEEALKHPYGERNFLRLFEEGWETRRPPEEPSA